LRNRGRSTHHRGAEEPKPATEKREHETGADEEADLERGIPLPAGKGRADGLDQR
jgi:hypothetical protein